MGEVFETIEKIAKKYYKLDFKHGRTWGRLTKLELSLKPRNDEVESFGEVKYHTIWDEYRNAKGNIRYVLVETNTAYNEGGLFTKLFSIPEKTLNTWLLKKSKEYLDSSI